MTFKESLDWHAKEGFLAARHKDGLTIYDYTPQTTWDKHWNEYTLVSRGLVVDNDGKVIARPFPKFFNLGERPETKIEALPAETPELSEKYDGSLIITFWNPIGERWQAITRGCWDNIQTKYGNAWIQTQGHFLNKEYTYLFELVAPWNRIVIPYTEARMILTGVIHTETADDWAYSKVREYGKSLGLYVVEYESRPIHQVNLDDPKVTSKEGYVARFSNGLRVKLKYAEYLLLHKILTGLSVKGIWELLSTGRTFDLSRVPDEFIDWFNGEKAKLIGAKKSLEDKAKELFAKLPKCSNRKEYATHVVKHPQPLQAMLFMMLNNQSLEEILWDNVKPVGCRTFQQDEG